MTIYNKLFFHSYKIGMISGNYAGIETLGGVLWTIPCVMFNILSLYFLAQGFSLTTIQIFDNNYYRYLIGLPILGALLFYYFYKGRGLKIYNKYSQKYRYKSTMYSWACVIVYYIVSFLILLLTGMFKNHDWIFKHLN
jgi:uncharacterized membrane protein